MRISRRWWKDPKEWHARSDRLGRQVDRIGWVLSESELWIFFRAFDFCLVSYIWCHVWIVSTFWVGPTSGSFSNIYILWVVSLQELQKFCNAQLGRKMWIVKRIQRRFSILFFGRITWTSAVDRPNLTAVEMNHVYNYSGIPDAF